MTRERGEGEDGRDVACSVSNGGKTAAAAADTNAQSRPLWIPHQVRDDTVKRTSGHAEGCDGTAAQCDVIPCSDTGPWEAQARMDTSEMAT